MSSSQCRMPRRPMCEQRNEDRQQLVHTGDQRHFPWLAVRAPAGPKGTQHRIVAHCRKRAHVAGRPHPSAATPDQACAPQRATVTIERSGALPTRAASGLCASVPRSGSSASRVSASPRPTPGPLPAHSRPTPGPLPAHGAAPARVHARAGAPAAVGPTRGCGPRAPARARRSAAQSAGGRGAPPADSGCFYRLFSAGSIALNWLRRSKNATNC